MEINILIKYENGIYTELRKVFDENKPVPVPDISAFCITFYYDDKLYSKKVVDDYLKNNQLTQIYGWFMVTEKYIKHLPGVKTRPKIKIAFKAILSVLKRPALESMTILKKYLTGGMAATEYELHVVPEELAITTGYKVLCYKGTKLDFKYNKSADIYIPAILNII